MWWTVVSPQRQLLKWKNTNELWLWRCYQLTKKSELQVISLHTSKVLHPSTFILWHVRELSTNICEARQCALSQRSKWDMIPNLSMLDASFYKMGILHGNSRIQIQRLSLIVSHSTGRGRRISSSPPGKHWSQIFKMNALKECHLWLWDYQNVID